MIELLLALTLWAVPVEAVVQADSAEIYLVNHGWHVGIVVEWAWAEPVWPELPALPSAPYIEVGWGDRKYYMHPDPGVGTTMRAGVWPTDSVLHLVAVGTDPAQFFRNTEVLRLTVPAEGYRDLLVYIAEAFERGGDGRAQPLGSGLYGQSQFYAGQAQYHVFNNCNHWVARALRDAGVSLDPVMQAEDLMAQLRPLAETVSAGE